MDTFINRAQRGFGKISTAISVALCTIAVISYANLYTNSAYDLQSTISQMSPQMRMMDSIRFGSVNNVRKENARFTFDLDADLTPLFNWNTKQVFAYVTIDYKTTSKPNYVNDNSLVIWDKIITSPEDAKLELTQARSKYSVYDVQKYLGGPDRAVEFHLRWDVQPHVGFLYNSITRGSAVLELPELKKPKIETQGN